MSTVNSMQVKFNNHEALSEKAYRDQISHTDFIALTTNNLLPLKSNNNNTNPLQNNNKRTLPSLDLFVLDFIKRANLPCAVFLFTLIYLVRLKSRLPKNAHGGTDTPFRLFLAAVLTSSKYLLEKGLTSISLALLTSHLYTARDINHMERSFLGLIRYDLWVSINEVQSFMDMYGDLIQADVDHSVE